MRYNSLGYNAIAQRLLGFKMPESPNKLNYVTGQMVSQVEEETVPHENTGRSSARLSWTRCSTRSRRTPRGQAGPWPSARRCNRRKTARSSPSQRRRAENTSPSQRRHQPPKAGLGLLKAPRRCSKRRALRRARGGQRGGLKNGPRDVSKVLAKGLSTTFARRPRLPSRWPSRRTKRRPQDCFETDKETAVRGDGHPRDGRPRRRPSSRRPRDGLETSRRSSRLTQDGLETVLKTSNVSRRPLDGPEDSPRDGPRYPLEFASRRPSRRPRDGLEKILETDPRDGPRDGLRNALETALEAASVDSGPLGRKCSRKFSLQSSRAVLGSRRTAPGCARGTRAAWPSRRSSTWSETRRR
ncbi:hypothetical protein M885DRAFT_333491 [Pelagophyceae sp. CCMP2097]|nr:hypothetical protein M885DRAFT_333491 [Pelagophyceae sp. CCMP2097]